MKICVDRDYVGSCFYFNIDDVKRACMLNGCDEEPIEICVDEMIEEKMTYLLVFATLLNNLKIEPKEER